MAVKFHIEKVSATEWKGYKAFLDALDGLSQGKWTISIDKYVKKRTLDQNAYYHKIVINCVRDGLIDAGFDPYLLDNDTVHCMLKEKFLKKDVGNKDGEFVTITRSTTELSTTEFMDYMDNIGRWAGEFLGITIPPPDSQGNLF